MTYFKRKSSSKKHKMNKKVKKYQKEKDKLSIQNKNHCKIKLIY